MVAESVEEDPDLSLQLLVIGGKVLVRTVLVNCDRSMGYDLNHNNLEIEDE